MGLGASLPPGLLVSDKTSKVYALEKIVSLKNRLS